MSEGSLGIGGNSTFAIRLRAVRAVTAEGLSVAEVARAYGTDRSTVHRWVARFVAEGEEGLLRRPVPGRPRKIASVDARALTSMLLSRASAFGFETDFWTTPRLVQVWTVP